MNCKLQRVLFQVWAHLLGINGDNQIPPRINHYAAVPAHFEALIKRYEELFKVSFFFNFFFQYHIKFIDFLGHKN